MLFRLSETQERPGAETGATQSVSAGGLRLDSMLSQPADHAREAVRFDSRRVRARRLIVRELDEFLGIFKYPDPTVIYGAAPSREATLDG